MSLTPMENERYQRQLLLAEVGPDGQEKIKQAKVLVAGIGGLGSPVAYYLTAAGVGRIGLLDSDQVDLSNLQRQILHFTPDVGRPKVESALDKLSALNPSVDLLPHYLRLTDENALALIEGYDLVVAAVDNLDTRYLLNRTCRRAAKPMVDGGINSFNGYVTTFLADGPCYQCLFPEKPPPSSGPIPLLGVMPGIIGTLQATEALKLILGVGTPLAGRMLFFDALAAEFTTISYDRAEGCPICGG